MVLQQQEPAQQNPHVLLGSIASDGGESSSHGGSLHVLGFEVHETKSDKHKPLFIGLFR
jgi:hypothetical protein